jgi:plasmid stabilization system protein ParE
MHNVKISDRANADLRDIQIYLTEYSEEIARKHVVRLANSIGSGAPYRAKLFFIGRTSFWIVYQFDEGEQAVNILRVWNSKQNPDDFEF